MATTALDSVRMIFCKRTAFLLWTAVDMRW